MKKVFALILAVLLCCSAFVICSGADTTQRTVTVSVPVLHQGTNAEYDWDVSAVFNGSKSTFATVTMDGINTPYVIGKLETPTVISSITYYIEHTDAGNAAGMNFYLSVTGEDGSWVSVGSIGTASDASSVKTKTEYTLSVTDSTAYSYLKWENGTLGSSACTIGQIRVYASVSALEVLPITYESSTGATNGGSASKVFLSSNTTAWNVSADGSVTGSFASPSCLTAVTLTTHGSYPIRLQNVKVEGLRANSEKWETLAIANHIQNCQNTTLTLGVDSCSLYSKIRICSGVEKGYFSLVNVIAYGFSVSRDIPVARYSQATTPKDGYQSIRFLSTVQASDYEELGYYITARIDGGDAIPIEKACQYLYESVTAKSPDGSIDMKDSFSAEQLGGKYVYALTVNMVPVEDGVTVSFVVTPYAKVNLNGVTVEIWGDSTMTSYTGGVCDYAPSDLT